MLGTATSQDKPPPPPPPRMHCIIRLHGLEGEFRWLAAQKNPVRNGELYRYISQAGAPP